MQFNHVHCAVLFHFLENKNYIFTVGGCHINFIFPVDKSLNYSGSSDVKQII